MSTIGYYSDDVDLYDDDPDEIRELAYTKWRSYGVRCNTATLRLGSDHAQDLGFYADVRAIHSALESRGRSR